MALSIGWKPAKAKLSTYGGVQDCGGTKVLKKVKKEANHCFVEGYLSASSQERE